MSADERATEIEAGLKILVQGLVEVRQRLEALEARADGGNVLAALEKLGRAEIRALERIAQAVERLAVVEEGRKR